MNKISTVLLIIISYNLILTNNGENDFLKVIHNPVDVISV